MAQAFKTTSDKYPGWTFKRDAFPQKGFTGAHPEFLEYRIGVYFDNRLQQYCAELLTRQQFAWWPAKTPFDGTVAECIVEIARRTEARKYYAHKFPDAV